MAGFYGKLPTKGDFLTRRLPREFIDGWDDWLQTGMNDSRQVLGDAWLQIYLTSPLWRFVLPAGVFSASGWAGVLMPSMDKVGRYFPMTIAAELKTPMSPVLVASNCNTWYEAVEKRLLDALDDDTLDMDEFDEDIVALEIDPLLEHESSIQQVSPVPMGLDQGVRTPLAEDLNVAQTFIKLTVDLLQESLGACSVWWGNGSERIPPSLVYCRGLPGPGKFTAMLDGQWIGHGWSDNPASPLATNNSNSEPPTG